MGNWLGLEAQFYLNGRSEMVQNQWFYGVILLEIESLTVWCMRYGMSLEIFMKN